MARHCPDKNSFLDGYSKFVADLGDHHKELKKSDWADIEQEFKVFADECYPKFKEDLSLSEKLKFWKNTIQYAAYSGQENEDVNLAFDDVNLDFSSEFGELTTEGKEELERFIKEEMGDDIENLIDDVLGELEKVGDEIKSWLKKK